MYKVKYQKVQVGRWEIRNAPTYRNIAPGYLKYSTIPWAGQNKEETEDQNAYF